MKKCYFFRVIKSTLLILAVCLSNTCEAQNGFLIKIEKDSFDVILRDEGCDSFFLVILRPERSMTVSRHPAPRAIRITRLR
jgi:hypothetical protein